MSAFFVEHFGWMQYPVVVARQLLAAVSYGMMLFLIASGLTLIFGVTRILNFAHGGMFMIGAYLAVTAGMLLPGSVPGFMLILLAGLVGLMLLGTVVEVGLLRRIYHAPHEFQLLLTFALVFVIGDAVKLIWGRQDYSLQTPDFLQGATRALGLTFPTYRLFLIGFGLAVAVGLWYLLNRTRWGTFVRAATMDRDMLSALGVNTGRLFTGVFALGAGLAGLGGALAAPIFAVGPGLHIQVIIEAFVVVVIGGMGSIGGALAGALLVGLVNAFGVLAFPDLALVMTFALMAIVLVVRPRGLFGKPE
ncbi:MAG: branched-chain amino acid ABC transporter permease [Sneathiellaceae bacterium]